MTEDDFKRILEENNAKLFGQLTKRFDSRLDIMETGTNTRIDRLVTSVDRLTKRIDDDNQESAAVDNQLDRHEAWLKQLGDKTGTKLIPEA